MPSFTPIPLGRRIPESIHAVSCSLPTMRSVRGYEEKDPETLRHLTSGYPRFVVHPHARELSERLIGSDPSLAGRTLWLVSSERMASELCRHLGGAASGAQTLAREGIHGVSHRADQIELGRSAKLFLQNIGGFLASREAEDCLVRLGHLKKPFPEAAYRGDAPAEIRRMLRVAMPGAGDRDLLLAGSGMNAIYATFRAVSEIQAARGRTVWIQLGWLYLDTIAILKRFSGTAGDYVYLHEVFDTAAMERLFASRGSTIAGVVAEIPTNPLIQTPDLAALTALCWRHGARLVLDPSVSSVFNLDLLASCDVVTSSLTKYTASEGDVVAGVAAINPAGADADELRRRIAGWLEPVYPRDLSRLAAQIGQTPKVVAQINATASRVAEFLSGHPAVRYVFWPLHAASRANYERIARSPGATGGMISFTLRTPMEPFYDRLRLPKGPSFGMSTTLICPFMYLAHYDLVTTPEGRAELAASGIDPDLLRLCVGCEPAEDIIAELAAALDGAKS